MDFGGVSAPIHPTLIVDETGGHTLVDAGLPDQEEAIGEAMPRLGCRSRTGAHSPHPPGPGPRGVAPHAGAAKRRAGHGASVDAPHVDGRLRPVKPFPEDLEQDPQARAVFERLRPTPVDEHLEDGSLLELAGGVRVISTPGHTPGHISLYLRREKTLIAGGCPDRGGWAADGSTASAAHFDTTTGVAVGGQARGAGRGADRLLPRRDRGRGSGRAAEEGLARGRSVSVDLTPT